MKVHNWEGRHLLVIASGMVLFVVFVVTVTTYDYSVPKALRNTADLAMAVGSRGALFNDFPDWLSALTVLVGYIFTNLFWMDLIAYMISENGESSCFIKSWVETIRSFIPCLKAERPSALCCARSVRPTAIVLWFVWMIFGIYWAHKDANIDGLAGAVNFVLGILATAGPTALSDNTSSNWVMSFLILTGPGIMATAFTLMVAPLWSKVGSDDCSTKERFELEMQEQINALLDPSFRF